MELILSVGVTMTHCLPDLLIGQPDLHSYLHFFGLHLSLCTIAIRNLVSSIVSRLFYFNCLVVLSLSDYFSPFLISSLFKETKCLSWI